MLPSHLSPKETEVKETQSEELLTQRPLSDFSCSTPVLANGQTLLVIEHCLQAFLGYYDNVQWIPVPGAKGGERLLMGIATNLHESRRVTTQTNASIGTWPATGSKIYLGDDRLPAIAGPNGQFTMISGYVTGGMSNMFITDSGGRVVGWVRTMNLEDPTPLTPPYEDPMRDPRGAAGSGAAVTVSQAGIEAINQFTGNSNPTPAPRNFPQQSFPQQPFPQQAPRPIPQPGRRPQPGMITDGPPGW